MSDTTSSFTFPSVCLPYSPALRGVCPCKEHEQLIARGTPSSPSRPNGRHDVSFPAFSVGSPTRIIFCQRRREVSIVAYLRAPGCFCCVPRTFEPQMSDDHNGMLTHRRPEFGNVAVERPNGCLHFDRTSFTGYGPNSLMARLVIECSSLGVDHRSLPSG